MMKRVYLLRKFSSLRMNSELGPLAPGSAAAPRRPPIPADDTRYHSRLSQGLGEKGSVLTRACGGPEITNLAVSLLLRRSLLGCRKPATQTENTTLIKQLQSWTDEGK